jgi:hypothetical protein
MTASTSVYDPMPRVDAAGGQYVHLVTTANRAEAKHFDDMLAAIEDWQSAGWRPDGKPNRQPGGYTVSLEAW